jgi:O-methyltransferase/aklanonic acid methyltransferase
MSAARTAAAWSALAADWDTAGAAWNQPVAGRLVELAGLRPGMVSLDIGCGAGAATIPAARAVHPAWVTAIDVSDAMVLRAQQQAAAAGVTNAAFKCLDAMNLPYQPACFDAVIASMVITHLPQPSAALRAWARLLTPHGVLAFSWVAAEDPAWQPVFQAVEAFLLPPRRRSARQRWSPAQAGALLPAGLTAATITEPVTTRYDSPGHWWQSAWTQAPAITWSALPGPARQDARQAAFAHLAGLRNRDGWLERTRTVCYTTARPAPPADVRAPGNRG